MDLGTAVLAVRTFHSAPQWFILDSTREPYEDYLLNQLLLQYAYLQVLDLLTTLAFMLHGVREGNPLVRLMMHATANPLNGLLVVKLIAVGLGLYCWRLGRGRLLARINIIFALIVAWNLGALILAAF
jgi:uncharacterized protein DUF5658